MTMQEKVRKELFARLSEGEHLVSKLTHSPTEFTERDKRVLNRLQIEIDLLMKLYDDEYNDLDENMVELADSILLVSTELNVYEYTVFLYEDEIPSIEIHGVIKSVNKKTAESKLFNHYSNIKEYADKHIGYISLDICDFKEDNDCVEEVYITDCEREENDYERIFC